MTIISAGITDLLGPRTPIIPIPPRSFPTTVLGVWRFDGTLDDEVGENDFVPATAGDSAAYLSFDKFELLLNSIRNRKGLSFTEGASYNVSPTYSYASDFTVAFWWFSPGLVGFARHATTRELEPKVAPIVAKANTNVSSSNSRVDLKKSTFAITEIGATKTEKRIKRYVLIAISHHF